MGIVLAVCLTVAVGCSMFGGNSSMPDPAPEPSPAPPAQPVPPTDVDPDAWLNDKINAMSLPEKIGQLFVIYGYGDHAAAPSEAAQAENIALLGYPTLADAVAAYHPGGVIYFSWTGNIGADRPEQLRELSAGLQHVAREHGANVPLFIGIDQEGGPVTRLGPPLTQFPAAMALAATGDTDLARMAAGAMAAELQAVGINWNFAPVGDVNVNPHNPVIGLRSFGANSERVAAFVTAQVRGYEAAGVAASVKHFPGHGNTDVDSHTGLPVITHSREEVDELDLPPFRAAIAAGVGSVMVGHLSVPALDPSGTPATFSHQIVTGVLREQLGYHGVVVTDALNMAGAAVDGLPGRESVAALLAGVDVLLMPPDVAAAIEQVTAAVATGELTEARIDESVRRVLRLKQRLGLFEVDAMASEMDVVGSVAHQELAHGIAARALTLVKNDGVVPIGDTAVSIMGDTSHAEALAASLAAASIRVTGPDATDVIIVLTSGALGSNTQRMYAETAFATGKPVIAVAVGEPYDLAAYPGVNAYVAAYGALPGRWDALANALTGQVAFVGQLPVTIPGLDGTEESN